MRIALTTYNRYDYTVRSLNTLVKTKFPENTYLVVVDDCSKDKRVVEYLKSLKWPEGVVVKIVVNDKQLHCDRNMLKAMKLALENSEEEFVVTIDSDVTYNPEWLNALVDARKKLDGKRIGMLSVFHTSGHSIKGKAAEGVIEKNSLGGFCAMINKKLLLHEDLEQSRWDWSYVDLCKRYGYGLYCTEKSYVEHFGAIGKSNGYKENMHYDKAINFVGE